MVSKNTNGSTRNDRRPAGADSAQGWLLRVTYARDEHDAEEMETLLPSTVRQEVTHADGDDRENHLDFSFTSEADAIAAAMRLDGLNLVSLEVEIFDV